MEPGRCFERTIGCIFNRLGLLVNPAAEITEPMLVDDNSLDQLVSPSSLDNYSIPLQCQTSTSAVLRNYRHNPLISGTNFQLSPVFNASDDAGSVTSLDDSMPPGLTACDTDASSDSGIDDVVSPMKQPLSVNDNTSEPVEADLPPAPPPLPELQPEEELEIEAGSKATSRKTSISFLDSSNPLLRDQDWMDLCNDDYNMNGGGFGFNENQLDQVLGWPAEIA